MSARNITSQSATLKREIANFLRTRRNGYELLHRYLASVPPDPPEPNWLQRSFIEALKNSVEAHDAEAPARK